MGYSWSREVYILTNNPSAALAVIDELERVCGLLAEMPGIGKRVEFITDAEYFMAPAGKYSNYLIFYTLQEKQLIVQRILHGKRNIIDLFK